MDFSEMTKEYYSRWLGVTSEVLDNTGIIFICSPERDKIQPGYIHAFAVYTYITQNLIIVSYSEKIYDKIEALKTKLHISMTIDEIIGSIKNCIGNKVGHNIKFCYDDLPNNINTSNVKMLTLKDYPKYLEFFKLQHPDANPNNWLEDYFSDMVKQGYCFGIFEENKLVSVTDTPDMPYMENDVQEIGINTLSEYRNKGYAKAVTLSCVQSLIKKGICPQWSCRSSNIGSEKLAYAVGYRKLADVITVRI